MSPLADSDQAMLARAFAHIDTLVERMRHDNGIPGLALAITDRNGLLTTRSCGFANLDAQTAVETDTLFEIGSIGKSFTAIVLLQLVAEGVIDLHVPVQTYLPWFEVQSEYGPITIHHLLTHTAGITGGSDHVPDPQYELWTLRRTRAYAAPGDQFHYSNLGYKALGLMLEHILQKPYAEIIQERIFQPIGMQAAWAEITHQMRPRLAVGYADQFDDRPQQPWHRLVPATWLESNTGDGCISTHASDLAIYLRTLLNQGSGPDGTLLSPEHVALMLNPHDGPSPAPTYGYALDRPSVEESHRFGHSGGMVGYVSQMTGDLDAGLGVVVLCNYRGSVREIADFALRTVIAARAGDPLPNLPAIATPYVIANATAYVGIYGSGDRSLEIVAHNDGLALIAGSDPLPLRAVTGGRSPDVFVADHPDFALAPLRFVREQIEHTTEPPETSAHEGGAVIELIHGTTWYPGERYEGPISFTYPEAWDAFVGHYRSHGPWFTNFRIGVLKGVLVLSNHGHTETLVPENEGFRIGSGPDSPDWIAFDAIVNGRALVARFEGGAEFARFFTP